MKIIIATMLTALLMGYRQMETLIGLNTQITSMKHNSEILKQDSSIDLGLKEKVGPVQTVQLYDLLHFDSIPLGNISIGKYKALVAEKETGSLKEPYKAQNRSGHLGKYQFSKRTLRGLGFSKEEINVFKDTPELQERAMDLLIIHNINTLKRYGAYKYIGKKIGGVTITEEGIIAASHLLGPYAVKHYLKNNGSMEPVKLNNGKIVKKLDGNGTSIKTYLRLA